LGYPDNDEIWDADQEKIRALDAQTRVPKLDQCPIEDGLVPEPTYQWLAPHAVLLVDCCVRHDQTCKFDEEMNGS
jgi:hypothetical protein